MKKIFLFILAAMLLMPANSRAETDFSVGADLVSSYVWRGAFSAGASFQPTVSFTAGNFTIGSWGSMEFIGFQKEVDLFATFAIGNFTIGLTDYWWEGEGAQNYFQFKKDASSHWLEVNLGYSFDCGLGLSWNTMVLGSGDKYADGTDLKRAFSTYVEAGYDFSIGSVNLTAALGVSPWKSNQLYTTGYAYGEVIGVDPFTGEDIYQNNGTEGFAVTNISLKASKEISITDKFSLPIYGQLIFNPAKEDTFLVFGISF
ncbi:MAG: hypothetical protein LBN37_00675 [Bacteroidales bacterium]|jgi:hypothetical protein|nr:hypothetical protein [Bacteroidales bacterium]